MCLHGVKDLILINNPPSLCFSMHIPAWTACAQLYAAGAKVLQQNHQALRLCQRVQHNMRSVSSRCGYGH